MEANVNTQKVGGEKPSLLGMIASPGVQFERMRSILPVWAKLVIVLVFAGLITAFVTYAMKDNPDVIKADQALPEDLRLSLTAKMIFGGVVGVITYALIFFIGAGIYKILMMLMSNDTPYKTLLGISVYTSIVPLLGALVNGILMLIIGSDQTSYTSLAPLFAKGSLGETIGANFEVFSLWGYVITALGLHIVAGLSKKQAAILVVVFFILSVGLSFIRA